MFDFRPISLANVVSRIISKAIANCLMIILPNVIFDAQNAFVPNRLIIDNTTVVRICMNITGVKEKLIIVIKLRKRQIDYKFWKQKQQFKKRRRESYSKDYFIFITSLSFAGALVDWAVAAAEDAGPLSLDFSLVRIGKFAKTNSWLWETAPPLEESLGVIGGFVVSRVTSFGFLFPSQLHQLALPLLEDCWEKEGPWPIFHRWSSDLWVLHHPGRLGV